MRKPYLLLLLVPAAALAWACSGDSTTTDGGTDATTDTTPQNDAAKTDGNPGTDGGTDGSTQDVNTQDVTISITCLEPANCVDGGMPDAAYPPDAAGVVCCGTITGNGQTQCQITSASTACKAPSTCSTDFTGLTSCGSATVRLCNSNAECTETTTNPFTNADTCCTAKMGDAGAVHVCANTTVAAASSGKITCP